MFTVNIVILQIWLTAIIDVIGPVFERDHPFIGVELKGCRRGHLLGRVGRQVK